MILAYEARLVDQISLDKAGKAGRKDDAPCENVSRFKTVAGGGGGETEKLVDENVKPSPRYAARLQSRCPGYF